jgi:hypothetical protein
MLKCSRTSNQNQHILLTPKILNPCLPGHTLTDPVSLDKTNKKLYLAVIFTPGPILPGQSPRSRIYPGPYSTWVQAAKLPVPVLTVHSVEFAVMLKPHWSAIL